MLNLGYKTWLLPYVEGTLDARRTAILEARLNTDPGLAAEVENLRRIDGTLRHTALAEAPNRVALIDARPSIWPRVQDVIIVRRGNSFYAPRFALAGGLAVVAAASIWLIGDHKPTSPALNTVASIAGPGTRSDLAVVPTPSPNLTNRHASTVPSPARTIVARPDTHTAPDSEFTRLSAPARIPSERRGAPRVAKVEPNTPHATPSVIDRAPLAPPQTPDRPTHAEPVVARINPTDLSASDAVHLNDVVSEVDTVDNIPSISATNFDLPAGAPTPDGSELTKAAVVSEATGGPRIRIDVADSADNSLKVLRGTALTAVKDATTPGDVKNALDMFRDALLVDLNPTVDQNSTTSTQADATLKILQETGHLYEFGDMIRQECTTRPNDITPWRIAGHTCTIEGDLAGAVDAWTHVVGMSNASAEDWFELARVQDAGGVSDGAVAAYSRVVDLGEPSRSSDAEARIDALTK